MLKHVQISPLRNRSDSISIRSTTSCSSSIYGGSPEPISPTASSPTSDQLRTPSRASSYCSLNDAIPQTTIKVFTGCLRLDIEYKTLGIQWDTTSKEVIGKLLKRCKLRQKDPRLFYLTMEVTVRRAGVCTILVLDDEARPAILQACHPKGDSRFCLQLKPGGLIRVHTSALQSTSQYKSLVISEETTSDELLTILLTMFNSTEPVEQFSLYEVCPGQEYQRKLHPDDIPLHAQIQRFQKGEQCHFLVRRNPNYPRRKQILPSIIESYSTTSLQSLPVTVAPAAATTTTSSLSLPDSTTKLSTSTDSIPNINNNNNNNNNTSTNTNTEDIYMNNPGINNYNYSELICKMCKNNFKSCEYCNKNQLNKLSTRNNDVNNSNITLPPSCISSSLTSIFGTSSFLPLSTVTGTTHSITPMSRTQHNGTTPSTTIFSPSTSSSTYNPVYNIREIRTVCHSFSSLGIDKKLLDIDRSMAGVRLSSVDNNNNNNNCNISNNSNYIINNSSNIVTELVNNNPAKGYGSYIYI